MKKVICLIQALILCVLLIVPAFAEESVFVPSITYKDGIEIVSAEMNDEDILDCLIVTSIAGAQAGSTDITQVERDLLLNVYSKLNNGSMELPVDADTYVICDLVGVSFKKTDCVEAGHDHKSWLAQEGTSVSVTFKPTIDQVNVMEVYTYVDGAWKKVETVDNGDGTITCTFEDLGPVAFSIAEEDANKAGIDWGWLVALIAALAGLGIIFFLLIRRNKDKDEKEDIKDTVVNK